jgi:hypothetical protein
VSFEEDVREGSLVSVWEGVVVSFTEKDWLAVDQPFSDLKILVASRKEKELKRTKLLMALDNHTAAEKGMKKVEGEAKSLTSTLRQKITENGVCPTCFRELDSKTIERMVK